MDGLWHVLKPDDRAKARFEEFLKMRPKDDPDRQRALRSISQPELARARMAPSFAITTTNGQRVSMDELAGLADRLLGDLVPALPRGSAAYAGDREQIPGAAAGGLSVSLDQDEQNGKTSSG